MGRLFKGESQQSLFLKLLLGSAIIMVVGGYILLGLDFTIGVLLGIAIVGGNLLWTRRILSKINPDTNPKYKIAFSYAAKFGLSAIILYFALNEFGVGAGGVLTGLSLLFPAILFYLLAHFLNSRILKSRNID